MDDGSAVWLAGHCLGFVKGSDDEDEGVADDDCDEQSGTWTRITDVVDILLLELSAGINIS